MLKGRDDAAEALIFLGEISHVPSLSLVKQLGIPQFSQEPLTASFLSFLWVMVNTVHTSKLCSVDNLLIISDFSS